MLLTRRRFAFATRSTTIRSSVVRSRPLPPHDPGAASRVSPSSPPLPRDVVAPRARAARSRSSRASRSSRTPRASRTPGRRFPSPPPRNPRTPPPRWCPPPRLLRPPARRRGAPPPRPALGRDAPRERGRRERERAPPAPLRRLRRRRLQGRLHAHQQLHGRAVLRRDHPRHAPAELPGRLRHRELQPLDPEQEVRVPPDPLRLAQHVRREGELELRPRRRAVRHPVRQRKPQRIPLHGHARLGGARRRGPDVRGGDEGTRARVPVRQVRRHPGHGVEPDLRRRRRAAVLQRLPAGPRALQRLQLLAQPQGESERRNRARRIRFRFRFSRRRAGSRRRGPGALHRRAHVAPRDARGVLAGGARRRDARRRAGARRVPARRRALRRHRRHRHQPPRRTQRRRSESTRRSGRGASWARSAA